jgi:hypothetical protein
LIQDQGQTRNLDSKIYLPGFHRFKFEFHSFFAETFSTVSAISGLVHCSKKSGYSITLSFGMPRRGDVLKASGMGYERLCPGGTGAAPFRQ